MHEFTEGPRIPASEISSEAKVEEAVPEPQGGLPRYPIKGMAILAFGGGGGLARPFLKGAAASGARLVIVEKFPEEERAREKLEKSLRALARDLADAGGRATTVLFADVTDGSEVAGAVARTKELLGSVDIGVDFAGVAHAPFDLASNELSGMVAEFRKVVEINLTGAFIVTAALAQTMVPQRSGHIIHLCSNGSRLSLYGSYGYNASKHGVEGLVKSAAAQLAPFGVRVNAIAPGTVETALNRYTLLRNSDESFKPRAKSILSHTPTKRFASPEGVAATLLSMCIPQPHLTGNVLFADDGYNIEGHSWPEANQALYEERLDELYHRMDDKYPQE